MISPLSLWERAGVRRNFQYLQGRPSPPTLSQRERGVVTSAASPSPCE